ncbi:MAG: asparagine synthase-related protein [Gemmatimonadaceae bacterium]
MSDRSAQRKHLLWVNHFAVTPDMGGGKRHFEMSRELVRRGWQVTIAASDFHLHDRRYMRRSSAMERHPVCEQVEGVEIEWLWAAPYEANDLRRVENWLTFSRSLLRDRFIARSPSVVIGSTPRLFAALAARRVARRAGVPFVLDASTTNEMVYGEYPELFQKSRAPTDEERWSYVLFKTFLPALNLSYGDRTSMATSVEMRVPFMDRLLVEQAGRIPLTVKRRMGRQKWVLGEAVRPWLPAEVVSRPKTGFGVPLRKWLAHDLHGQVRKILLGERLLSRGFFRREGIARLLLDLESGRRDVSYLVWAILTFEVWARTFIDADGSAPIERLV